MDSRESDLVLLADVMQADGLAEHTRKQYLAELRRYFEHTGESLTLRSALAYTLHVKAIRGPNAWNLSVRALKRYSKLLAHLDDTEDNLRTLKVPQTASTPEHGTTATETDIKRLLGVCDGSWRGVRDRAIVLTLTSGMRRSEVASMIWSNLDRAEGVYLLPTSKTGKPRVVALTKPTILAIAKYERRLSKREIEVGHSIGGQSDHIWWGAGGGKPGNQPMTPSGIGQMVLARSREAGVSISPHSFRRGLAVDWLDAGGSETGLMRQCGWTSTRMVARYSQQRADALSLAEFRRLVG
jgi:integrase